MKIKTLDRIQSILLQLVGSLVLIVMISSVIKSWDKCPWYDWILPIAIISSAVLIIILGRKWNK